MRQKINAALKEAMKEKDKIRLSTLRLIMAAIKDRDIAIRSEGKEAVADEQILEIMSKMVKQRRESASIYEEAGRLQLAQQEQDEIAIISEFMPEQMSDEDIKAACQTTITNLGSSGLKDMGKTMGALKSEYAGSMDFGKAGKFVKELLV